MALGLRISLLACCSSKFIISERCRRIHICQLSGGQGRLRKVHAVVCSNFSARPTKKRLVVTSWPPEFGGGPCLRLRPGRTLLSLVRLHSQVFETFLLFRAELSMFLTGWLAFDFSCPVKFLREADFSVNMCCASFFQRNRSEGCSKDKRLHSQLFRSK